ncbi:MAG: Cu(I)-responsive transcriptional regulator [Burkholderiales bacterium]
MDVVGSLNIGRAARLSGVSAKMIRHYESLGLLPKVRRTGSGYCQYSTNEVHTLRFIRRARGLGFSIGEIATLLGLWRNRRRASADVKPLALAHAAELAARIAEMTDMKKTLEWLAAHCHGDHRPERPILDDLAAGESARAAGGGESRGERRSRPRFRWGGPAQTRLEEPRTMKEV